MTRSAIHVGMGVALAAALSLVAPRSADARPMLYPTAPRTIRFAHTTKAHAALPCARCHGAVARSTSAREHHAPREAACRSCHAAQTRPDDRPRHRAGGKRCGFCHVGHAKKSIPALALQPEPRLRFSHRIHAAKGVGCRSCHGAGTKTSPTMPAMATCTSCHQARKVTNRCVTCHLSTKAGRLRTRFGRDRLVPRRALVGLTHTRAFTREHGSAARSHPTQCKSCHAPPDCARCHAGSFKPLSIHGADYLTHHVIDARRNKPRCSSCHRLQTFCASCHVRSGVGRTSRGGGGFRPTTGVRFHPPGFDGVKVGPKHHAFAARRNINTCASCHAEQTCIRCHSTRATGFPRAGFSPHGARFSKTLRCRNLARRNPRACLKCHASADPKIECR